MIGRHIRKHKTLNESIQNEKVAQVFLLNPFSGATTTNDADLRAIKQIVIQKHITLIVHGAYVDNPWSSGSIELIKRELDMCHKCAASGLIVHLGTKTNESISAVLHKIIKEVKQDVLDNVTLWLEINSAKQSNNTFESPAKLNKLFTIINEITRGSTLLVGLCIDTAHLWACGVSMSTYNNAQSWLNALKVSPIMFHLNDSSSELASGKDVHAPLCQGKIWHDHKRKLAESGIACIINYAKKNKCVIILERHDDDIEQDMAVLKKLI